MKKRAILGILVAVAFSVLLAGTALAKTVNITYPEGDPKLTEITEWEILPDGRVHCAAEVTAPNGYSAGIIETGKNGEPIVTTFLNEEDFVAAQEARGWEPFSFDETFANHRQEDLENPSRAGNGHIGIGSAIKNASGTNINWSTFITNYSFNSTQVTYYAKHPYSFSEPKQLQNGWKILSGPNYTAPSPIPTSTSALGTYNTSFTGPAGAYNWLSL